jgi:acetyltransferase-like isoleucine patch superfamily enzyme
MNRLSTGILGRLAMFLPGGYSIRPTLQRLRGVRLGKRVWISQSVYLDELYPEAITIGDGTTIGFRTSIFSHFHWGPHRTSEGSKPVVIGANVFVGPHCVILPGVHIGRGAVIKAGTVVSRNVPPDVFFGDSPGRPLARVTVALGPESTYEEFVRGLRPLNHKTRPTVGDVAASDRPGGTSP